MPDAEDVLVELLGDEADEQERDENGFRSASPSTIHHSKNQTVIKLAAACPRRSIAKYERIKGTLTDSVSVPLRVLFHHKSLNATSSQAWSASSMVTPPSTANSKSSNTI